jgi:3'-phosphoadenosine 5'-phosphosulfate sulfotransferase (PAPS reductase)/FAD synthetase
MPSILPAADELLISYSGGKDSLACCQILKDAGRRFSCMYMFFIPGLDFSRFWCEYAADTFHVKVRQYQHWNTSNYLRNGIFRSPVDVPAVSVKEVEAMAKRESGCEWIGYGYKSRDSLERRGILSMYVDGINAKEKRFAPIKDWSEKDVKAYLSRSGIIIPNLSYGRSVGVNVLPSSMLYLRENWPSDYDRVLQVFPGAAAQADRALELQRQKEIERELAKRNRPERPKRVSKKQTPDVLLQGDPALHDPHRSIQSALGHREVPAAAEEADREERACRDPLLE